MSTQLKLTLAFCGTLLVSACQTSEPEAPVGDSVRALIAAQTLNAPPQGEALTRAPQGTDPDRAVAAVEAMRGGVAKPSETWGSAVITGAAATSGN